MRSLYSFMDIDSLNREMESCTKCDLYKTRNSVVYGEGNIHSKVMFIAEAPGAKEDLEGRPFVGKAGKVLDGLLSGIGISREEVYIANILKCRPPKNRDPLKEEIIMCTPYLKKQIEQISPKIVCTFGRFSSKFVMDLFGIGEKFYGITQSRGNEYKGNYLGKEATIFPMFHPAATTYDGKKLGLLKEDFKKLKNKISSLN